MAQMPQTITTHGFVFRLQIRYGIKQLYPKFSHAETTCFVGYFLTDCTAKGKKKAFFDKYGVWNCERLASKQRVHEYTDALLAIPLLIGTNHELETTLKCLARTLVDEVNGHREPLRLLRNYVKAY